MGFKVIKRGFHGWECEPRVLGELYMLAELVNKHAAPSVDDIRHGVTTYRLRNGRYRSGELDILKAALACTRTLLLLLLLSPPGFW